MCACVGRYRSRVTWFQGTITSLLESPSQTPSHHHHRPGYLGSQRQASGYVTLLLGELGLQLEQDPGLEPEPELELESVELAVLGARYQTQLASHRPKWSQ